MVQQYRCELRILIKYRRHTLSHGDRLKRLINLQAVPGYPFWFTSAERRRSMPCVALCNRHSSISLSL